MYPVYSDAPIIGSASVSADITACSTSISIGVINTTNIDIHAQLRMRTCAAIMTRVQNGGF